MEKSLGEVSKNISFHLFYIVKEVIISEYIENGSYIEQDDKSFTNNQLDSKLKQ